MNLIQKHKQKSVKAFLFLLMIGMLSGLYGFYGGHDHTFNNTREAPWGLLISSYAFLAITSTGLCITGTLGHVLKNKSIERHGKKILWGSVASMLGAFSIIGMELEAPWRMLWYNIVSPGLTSNIWWMGTLYGLALSFMVVELYLIYKKKYKMALGLGVAGVIAEVMANTNLGAVFATMASSPFWYGAQLPIFFLVCACLSGLAVTSLIMYYNDTNTEGMTTVSKLMLVFLALVSLATVWKFVIIGSCGSVLAGLSVSALTSGALSVPFWMGEIGIGIIIPIITIISYLRTGNTKTMAMGSCSILIGQFIGKYNMVVAGKIVDPVSLMVIPYIPSVTEWMIVVMAIGLIGYLWVMGNAVIEKVM